MGRLDIIDNGAVLVRGEKITAIGPTPDLLHKYPDETQVDASGMVVMPGFVDPHTHVVWAGDRAAEFEMRLQGKSYLEIMNAGGGIVSTVKATRAASVEELKNQTRPRLWQMLRHGSTTIEVKTGYGLDQESELRMLQAILELDEEGPWDLVPTYLGAHAIAPEYKDDPDGYTHHLINYMLPNLKKWWQQNAVDKPLPYVDVFCETGAFSLQLSRVILEKAKELGFPLKIHADEFDNLGGVALAQELGARSADHLVATSQQEIEGFANSDTFAVSLPGTPFGLAEESYTPARDIIEANGYLAIASDLNPGTSWCENMQMMVALACRYMKLTPAQAIVASTINSAAAIGQDQKVGSIDVGKQADILILDIPDYRHLGYRYGTNLVHKVIKKGMLIT